jgi:hypothetical protein
MTIMRKALKPRQLGDPELDRQVAEMQALNETAERKQVPIGELVKTAPLDLMLKPLKDRPRPR